MGYQTISNNTIQSYLVTELFLFKNLQDLYFIFMIQKIKLKDIVFRRTLMKFIKGILNILMYRKNTNQ